MHTDLEWNIYAYQEYRSGVPLIQLINSNKFLMNMCILRKEEIPKKVRVPSHFPRKEIDKYLQRLANRKKVKEDEATF